MTEKLRACCVNSWQACAVNFGDMCEVVGQHSTETYLVCSVMLCFGLSLGNGTVPSKLFCPHHHLIPIILFSSPPYPTISVPVPTLFPLSCPTPLYTHLSIPNLSSCIFSINCNTCSVQCRV